MTETKTVWSPEPGPGMVQGVGPDGDPGWRTPGDSVDVPAKLFDLDSRVKFLEQSELRRRRADDESAQEAVGRRLYAVKLKKQNDKPVAVVCCEACGETLLQSRMWLRPGDTEETTVYSAFYTRKLNMLPCKCARSDRA